MTMITINNEYGSVTVSIKQEEMSVDNMFDMWKGAMSGLGYQMDKFILEENYEDNYSEPE